MNQDRLHFYTVSFLHRDLELWREHLAAHTAYLKDAVAKGVLRASGPLRVPEDPYRRGFLIFACADKDQLIANISADPFHIHGVIDAMEILEWDPVFGAFSAESSGQV